MAASVGATEASASPSISEHIAHNNQSVGKFRIRRRKRAIPRASAQIHRRWKIGRLRHRCRHCDPGARGTGIRHATRTRNRSGHCKRLQDRELSAADLAAWANAAPGRESALKPSPQADSSLTAAKAKPIAPTPDIAHRFSRTVARDADPRSELRRCLRRSGKNRLCRAPQFPESKAAHICHLVLMKLVPGLKEEDIEAFGSALTEIQEIVGGHFGLETGRQPVDQPGRRRACFADARCGRDRHRTKLLGADRLRLCR